MYASLEMKRLEGNLYDCIKEITEKNSWQSNWYIHENCVINKAVNVAMNACIDGIM